MHVGDGEAESTLSEDFLGQASDKSIRLLIGSDGDKESQFRSRGFERIHCRVLSEAATDLQLRGSCLRLHSEFPADFEALLNPDSVGYNQRSLLKVSLKCCRDAHLRVDLDSEAEAAANATFGYVLWLQVLELCHRQRGVKLFLFSITACTGTDYQVRGLLERETLRR